MPETQSKTETVKPNPAPWHIRPQYGSENVYRLWDKEDNYHDDTSPEVMDANSRLMEAAPDGLELARLVVGYFPKGRIDPLLDCDIRLRKLARQIIAKAEGR